MKRKENDANLMHGWSKISEHLFVAGNHLNAAVELYGDRKYWRKAVDNGFSGSRMNSLKS